MRDPGSTLKLLCLLGPTAVGKTNLAIPVAQQMDAEIISVDSKQIYRYMDIGTAKPTSAERALVPHHLIDCVDPDQPFCAADFQKCADAVIHDITRRHKKVLIVGGSGLYFRALIDGLFEVPRTDQDVRQCLHDELEKHGKERLHAQLEQIDPEAASRIHVNDVSRVIRALEVYELTGIPISRHQQQWKQSQARYPFRAFVISRPRPELYERIDQRVEKMLRDGWIDEVRSLLAKGYGKELVSMQGLGYRELVEYLEGTLGLGVAVEQIKLRTRRYAKRQLTWFRGDKRLRWIDLSANSESSVMQRLMEVNSG